MSLGDRVKKFAWIFLEPVFIFFREALLALGLMRHEERQPYLLGRLLPSKSKEEFEAHLRSLGFDHRFMSWNDLGELLNLRKTNTFRYQYHVRFFKDGEVRAHYEYTPEYKPISHIMEWGMEPKTEEFLAMFGDWLEK